MRQIEAAVKRMDGGYMVTPCKGKGQIIDMAMDDVELLRTAENLGKLENMISSRIRKLRVEPDRPGAHRTYFRARLGIACREECYFMAPPGQFFSKEGDNAFRAAIKGRRHGFNEGSDLCDMQGTSPNQYFAGDLTFAITVRSTLVK
jgi:hypothetical protein